MLNNGQLINNVKIKKSELLFELEKNLLKHGNDVKEALELRRAKMKDYFLHQASKIDSDSSYNPEDYINFPVPVDNSEDYKRAIKMVSMTQDDIIELSENQFDKLVMDNWDWKKSLISTSSVYGKSI